MAYNKIEANGETLIDLTGDTVTADTLVSGRTAHLASGEKVTGTFIPVTGVKGNAETAYRTGNVNLTAANLGLDPLGYYGIGGRTTNTTTNPWVLVAETTASNNNNAGITLLFDYTYTSANNATSTGTGILSINVRTSANGAIDTNRSYAKWLTRTNELNNDDVVITYNNSTKSLQIWGKSDFGYKIFRVRPLSGSDRFNLFDISKWTFTTSLNTNMYESYPTGDGITVLTPTCDIALLKDRNNDITTTNDDTRNITLEGSGNVKINGYKIQTNNITMPYANNAGFHNSIYRGKNLGTSYTAAQKAEVQAGTFDDLFVGDYWVINGVTWRIAHCDYYLNTGDTATTAHHLVIVPDETLTTSYMNATNVTTDAYVGSYMYATTLLQDGTEASDSVFGKIKAAFGESNLLSIRQMFANAVDSDGNVSDWAFYTTSCFLMNQAMVYGQKAWSNGNNDGYNVGIDKSQLALFAHNSTSINTRQSYWLRDVCSSTGFAVVGSYGSAGNFGASRVSGVRPAVLLS